MNQIPWITGGPGGSGSALGQPEEGCKVRCSSALLATLLSTVVSCDLAVSCRPDHRTQLSFSANPMSACRCVTCLSSIFSNVSHPEFGLRTELDGGWERARGDCMSLAEQIETLLSELFAQGSLDEEQFSQLQMLQDESNEGFLAEIITLYLEDTEGKLRSLREMLATQNVDHTELESIFHQLKGSSSSVGASEVAKLCVECRDLSLTKGPVEVAAAVDHIFQTFEELKTRLQQLLQLQSQLAAQS